MKIKIESNLAKVSIFKLFSLYLVPSGNIHNFVFSFFRVSLAELSFSAAC